MKKRPDFQPFNCRFFSTINMRLTAIIEWLKVYFNSFQLDSTKGGVMKKKTVPLPLPSQVSLLVEAIHCENEDAAMFRKERIQKGKGLKDSILLFMELPYLHRMIKRLPAADVVRPLFQYRPKCH